MEIIIKDESSLQFYSEIEHKLTRPSTESYHSSWLLFLFRFTELLLTQYIYIKKQEQVLLLQALQSAFSEQLKNGQGVRPCQRRNIGWSRPVFVMEKEMGGDNHS